MAENRKNFQFAVVDQQIEKANQLKIPWLKRDVMVGYYAKPTMDYIQALTANPATPEVPVELRKLASDTVVEAFRCKLDDQEFADWLVTYKRDYHNRWLEYAARNPGAINYCMAQMAHSDYIMPFWLDILTGKIGQASTAPYFVLRGFDDKMHVVEPTDPAFHTCYADRNFIGMRNRARKEYEAIQQLSENGGGAVAFLGGGLVPVAWAFGPLPSNVELVVFDCVDYSARLRELLETDSLDSVGITYVVGDFLDTATERYFGTFDLAIVDGVLAYHYTKEAGVIGTAHNMLKSDGPILCDLQVQVTENALDALILGWPQMMHCEANYEATKESMEEILKETERNFPGAYLRVKETSTPFGATTDIANVAFRLEYT